MPRSLIIGLGNPILTDDAVGLAVARLVHERLADPETELAELAVGGLELVERLAGYERVVIIDAIRTEGGEVGECRRVELDGPESSRRTAFTHEVGLSEGLELARRLGMELPQKLSIYAIEIADPYTVSEEMTAEVRAAVPRAAEMILAAEFGR